MHPIEHVHKQILAGNVLSQSGTWISRNEALKQKRYILKHVLDGEVEVGGKWVKLSEVESKSKIVPFIATQQKQPNKIHEKPLKNIPKKSTPQPQPEQPAPSAPEPENTITAAESLLLQQIPQPKISPYASEVQELTVPADPLQSTDAEESVTSGEPGKQTITIRTMPLGKDTMLTISESRAGNGLVAVCSLQGFLDQTNADDFHIQLMSMLDFGVRYFVIDFEHTNLVGSAGWGVLAVAARLIKGQKGHLLICSMSQDIHESFMLLQFNEVIDSRATISESLEAIHAIVQDRTSQPEQHDDHHHSSRYGESFEDLPIQEKIKHIIARNGPVGFFKIKDFLQLPEYGKVKISILKLHALLKELNLDTSDQRTRFYRSC